jgi:hypothetical protein
MQQTYIMLKPWRLMMKIDMLKRSHSTHNFGFVAADNNCGVMTEETQCKKNEKGF